MKRKGFTLIELLAVIIIVGIIALIATPMIFNVMKDSGSATFKQTLNNIVDSAKIYKTREEKSNPIRDCRYFSFGDDVSEVTVRDTKTYYPVKDLEVKGKLPTEGELEICIDKISLVANDDEYCGIYDDGSGVNVIDCTLSENKVSVPIIDIFNATTTTNKIIISISAHNSDPSSDIVNYYYKIDDGEYQKTPNSSYIFDELRPDERHTIYVKVENDLGITAEDSKIVTTKDFGTLEIAVKDIGKWTPSKEVTLSGNTNDYQIEYRIKKYNFETNEEEFSDDFITYSAPFELKSIATKEHPITVYARFNDGYNVTEEQTMKITMIDPEPPKLNLGSLTRTTTSVTIPFEAIDKESGISETTCVYGTSTSYGQTGVVNGNTCTLNGLTEGVKYYYKIETINNSRLSTNEELTVTAGIPTINYDVEQTPTSTSYAQSKKVKVSYSVPDIDTSTYYVATSVQTTSTTDLYGCSGTTTGTPSNCTDDNYPAGTKLSAGRWYMIKGNYDETEITFTANGTIYNLIHDGESYIVSDTLDINKIDTTEPSVEIETTTKTTTSVTIPFEAIDKESGISETTCVYGTSSSYGKTGVISQSGDKCTLAGLTKGTEYYYKIEATNNSGLSTKRKLTVATGSTSVGFDITQTPTDTEYAQSKTVTVEYTTSNITSPEYYIASSVAATTTWDLYGCSGDTTGTPSNCTDSIADGSTISASRWYKLKGTNKKTQVSVTANGTIYGMIYDGENFLTAETQNVNKIDTTAPSTTKPTVAQSTSNAKALVVTNKQTDAQSGLDTSTLRYGYSTSSSGTYTWQTSNTFSNLTAGTTYYFKTKVTNKSGLSSTSSATSGKISFTGIPTCDYAAGDIVTYFGNQWLVITDNGTTVKLIKGWNISKGAFDTGGSNEYKDSTAYDTINTWFNSVSTLKKDLAAGAIITDSNGYYVRLPYYSELTTTPMPSSAGTPFWTMSKNTPTYFTAITSFYQEETHDEVRVAFKDGTFAVKRYHYNKSYTPSSSYAGISGNLKTIRGYSVHKPEVYSQISSTYPTATSLVLPTGYSSTTKYYTNEDLVSASGLATRYVCDNTSGSVSTLVSSLYSYAPGGTACTNTTRYIITDTNYGEIGYRPVITVRKNPDNTTCS